MSDTLAEIGLTLDQVAVTAHRAFMLSLDQDPDGDVAPGWSAVARHVAAVVESAEDSELALSFTQLANLLRKEFVRANDGDGIDFDGFPGWERLTRQHQLAWVAVARHLLNVFSFDEREARRLGQHEGQIADWARAQLAAA